MDPKETKDLLNRIGWGDDKARTELYRVYHPSLLSFLCKRLPSEADAKEVAQDTFNSFFAQPGRFESRSAFETYLKSIAKNKALDWWRKNYPRSSIDLETDQPSIDPQIDSPGESVGYSPDSERTAQATPRAPRELPSPDPNPEESLSAKQCAVAIDRCMDRLSEIHGEVIRLVDFEGLSVTQVAARLGVPPGTVKRRHHDAREAMKDCMEKRGWKVK